MVDLPAFVPADDALPPPVVDLLTRIDNADAVVVSTPEYAGGLPGSLKNLLDRTVGGGQCVESQSRGSTSLTLAAATAPVPSYGRSSATQTPASSKKRACTCHPTTAVPNSTSPPPKRRNCGRRTPRFSPPSWRIAMPTQVDDSPWPSNLRPGAIRFGRASQHYAKTIAFYRDMVGLPIVGEFTVSFGEDGTIFGLPDTTVQLEIIRAHEPTAVAEFDPLVLYLDSPAAVVAATAPLRAAGLIANLDPHPYWAANRAVVYDDPDGREVVLAPWVYGRDPDPVDRLDAQPATEGPVRVEWYDGDRELLRSLFSEAEDSVQQLDSYINDGRVLVAWRGADRVGHLQVVTVDEASVELKNMAVAFDMRGTGLGRKLVHAALAAA